MRSLIYVVVAFNLFFLPGCSHKKESNPIAPPPVLHGGRVSILNNSEVPISIAGYVQERGTQRQQIQLWVHLFPNQNFTLNNLIDPGQSQLFPGGDKVTLLYYADAPDPSNPSQPLFQATVELIVDGNLLIQVKSGGEYGISPG